MGKRKLNVGNLFKLLILTALTICFLSGGWVIYVSVRDLPSLNPDYLHTVEPTVIYDSNGNFVNWLGYKKVSPVKLSQVPQVVKNAFLAAEDIRFYQNSGIDLRSFARAAWNDLTTLSLNQGASTITGQLAKNAFLADNHSIKYKIQETLLALELTHQYSKDEILEMYLNKIYLGDGAYGVGAAARAYFNKDISQLTLSQATLIAGLAQAPSAYSPVTHPDVAKKRRDEILVKMVKYNLINEQQYQDALSQKISLDKSQDSGKKYPYFVDYVVSRLAERLGEDNVYRGGLKVYTTLDPTIQLALEKAFTNKNNFPPSVYDAKGVLQPEGASVFLNPQTGAIQAMIGGRVSTGSQVLNRAVQTYRQPGSSIKPFVAYGPVIEYDGMTPDSIVDDSPVRYGNYEPHNDDNEYQGPVSLRTALAKSINVAAVKLLDMAGIPQAVKFAQGVGINSLVPQKEGLSMALGGLYKGVSPLEMAAAYGAIANCGVYVKPFVISKVIDRDGSVLYEEEPEMHQAMQPQTAADLTSMMQTAVLNGTGTNANLSLQPVAGKTGTTEHGKDLWFCGFSPQLAGVVWIGYDHPQNMPGQYGGTHPAQIWQQVMNAALANKPAIQFRDLYPGIYPEPAVSPDDNNSSTNDNTNNLDNQTPPDNNPQAGAGPEIKPPSGNTGPEVNDNTDSGTKTDNSSSPGASSTPSDGTGTLPASG